MTTSDGVAREQMIMTSARSARAVTRALCDPAVAMPKVLANRRTLDLQM